MKKLIDFGKSPWPMLILTALSVVVAVLTSLDWSYSEYAPDRPAAPAAETPVKATQP
ncbi:hypothetical protein [Halomicronema sp. CCY15110]|uniref:hypothetical protein n=1 Tax=Halomicronema sp. CCY15110 TaxID=2767773 RepID=UPI001951E8D5|nr:hypothetical protein [Halomicronema sp. CCY15110]